MRRFKGLFTQPAGVAVGHYIGVLAPGNTALRDRVNAALRAAMQDGRLEAIFRKWQVWNDDQPRFFAATLAGGNTGTVQTEGAGATDAPRPSAIEMTRHYLPSFLTASLV